MASPPQCAFAAAKPDVRRLDWLRTHRQTNHRYNRQNRSYKVCSRTQNVPRSPVTSASSLSGNTSIAPFSSSDLSADFSARRSTRAVSKLHFGRPRSSVSANCHSVTAEEVLQLAIRSSGDHTCMDRILHDFESRLSVVDDYTFLIRELGNRGELSMAMCCFDFAICRESKRKEQGKLASTMISVLGRLGNVDSARNVFENAVNEGYGDTVYAYSALISAYAKSGYCDDAIRVFETMKDSGLKPNLVTYNALIDACGKGGADLRRALEFFDLMLKDGVQPDRITYNSLLAVCSGAGLWDTACCLFNEMVAKGIDQDIYTYNTLLDVACEADHKDAAFDIMSEMLHKNILPNEVTYSTLIRGCAKSGELDRALGLFNEAKYAGVRLDTVSYNNLLAIYANLGRLQEALAVVEEMESIGIKKDVVTYNALLDGFGKQGMYDRVKELFQEMKAESLSPNLLTCSTLICVYSKGGLYHEAVQVYEEFKCQGLKEDVVFYSKLIDALCKKGLVKSSVSLLDEMIKKGIQPNIVTYNSIINAYGCSAATENPSSSENCKKSSASASSSTVAEGKSEEKDKDRIIKIFEELAAGKSTCAGDHNSGKQDFVSVLGIFKMMRQMEIKPNVVTFSSIMNACSRCSSFVEASLLLEELQLFDNQVYSVAHGLLMGNDERIWMEARSLFDKVKQMDSATASTFYNALADMLWQFGQRRGAQMVVLEGKHQQVWESTFSISELDLHLMSSGAAMAMVHVWLLSIHSIVFKGRKLPKLLSIMTGWGKHSKVVGDGALKPAIEVLLSSMGAPFQISKCNIGRFESKGSMVATWLRESGTLKVLVLHDRMHPKSTRLEYIPDLLPVPS